MKIIILILMVTFSVSTFATMEHKEGIGTQPTAQRLSKARGCFEEIDEAGCGHPRNGQAIFNTCLENKITSLSSTCQDFFQKLYGKKD